jgi:hypothetical protein
MSRLRIGDISTYSPSAAGVRLVKLKSSKSSEDDKTGGEEDSGDAGVDTGGDADTDDTVAFVQVVAARNLVA